MTTKLLIAVKSCQKHAAQGYNDAIRESWGSAIPREVGFRFFMGWDSSSVYGDKWRYDEVQLWAKDSYDELPNKTRQILKWFLRHEYDYIFLCDTDTFIVPKKLVRCGYERFDVAGRFGAHPEIGSTFPHQDDRNYLIPHCHPWPSGGVGYFLSRMAAQIVINTEPMTWAEDLYVGQATGPYIQLGLLSAVDIPNFEGQVAWHFPRRLHNNQVYNLSFNWLDKMHREYGQ